MSRSISRPFLGFVLIIAAALSVSAQKKAKTGESSATPVLWQAGNISKRDLFAGPGGDKMRPDLSSITLIDKEKHGHQPKVRIKDGSGNVWIAKFGREARPETAAVRLTWGIGYKSEVNYLIPSLTIPGKGTFNNVRLEARPDDKKRLDEWKWRDNPFIGTDELQGLKIMMVFLNNWDIYDGQNKVLKLKGEGESDYIVSDLGSTFGKLGNNNFPVIYRLGRSVGKPKDYTGSQFIKGVKDGRLILAYKGKNRDIFQNITLSQARWLVDKLTQLNDRQIRDAFRAANYSPAEIDAFAAATRRRINELANVTSNSRLAVK